MKEIFKTLNSQNINGFIFMYHEFNNEPGLIYVNGPISLCVKYNREQNRIVLYKFNALLVQESFHHYNDLYNMDLNADILMGFIVDFTQDYIDKNAPIIKTKPSDSLIKSKEELLDELRNRLEKARTDWMKNEYEEVEKIAEANGLNSTFIYMEKWVYDILKHKPNFKDAIIKK